jgi:iron complex outermembrane receptor protein
MFFTKHTAVLLLGVLVAASSLGVAQTEHPQTWAQDLNYLASLSSSEEVAQHGAINSIRAEITQWLQAHPDSKITLAAAPSQPWDERQAKKEVEQLSQVVEKIVRQYPSRPFHLGQTEVEVTALTSPLSPVATSISQADIQLTEAVNATKAIDELPGVEIQHLANNRNEAAFMIRGFSSNGQVPLYLDGIPIYVPYDGYIDLNRFLTSDLAEIQVARGYSSPLLGPNALGGSVNLVTREPAKKYEGDALIGTGSGNQLLSALHLGTRGEHYFAQATLDWLQADYVPLSGNFQYPAGGYTALTTPSSSLYTSGNVPYPLTDHENNSATRDEKWSGRFGWTPKGADEYVFSYINQKGQKGVPFYQGEDTAAKFRNFWSWPYWNKDSYYFLSNTGLGEKSSIKFRAFYDQFRNSINMYDNSAEDTMNSYNATKGSGSEISRYDDHTDGASTEFNSRIIPRNNIGASFFFKDDDHREYGIYGATSSSPLTIPNKVLRDQQTSIGLQDVVTITSRLHATVGFSADHLKGMQAETYNALNSPAKGDLPNTLLVPYLCADDPTNTSFAGCTAHYWNLNPQASATYTFSSSDSAFVTFADRGRFPTLKQRYSSGMGSAIPNPDLKGERAQNWNIGYMHIFNAKLTAQAQLFHSNLTNAIESALVPDPLWNPTTDPTDLNGLCPNNSSVGHCSQNINIGKETHEGVEFEVHARPLSRLALDANYSYLNRTIGNAELPTGTTLSSPLVLPTGLPKNKLMGTATVQLPLKVTGLVRERYEGGVTLQDTTYLQTSPLYSPHGEAIAVTDLAVVVPVKDRFRVQAGISNLFDRNYFYTAGYPEEGRNWYLNLRYQF